MVNLIRARRRAASGALGGSLVLIVAGTATLLPSAAQAAAGRAAASVTAPGAGTESTDSVLGWGQDSYGQLGNGHTTGSQDTPVTASLPSGTLIPEVAAGYDDSLAVTTAGGVLAWGNNGTGQLGDGSTTASGTPVAVDVQLGTRVTQVAAGDGFSLGVTSSGGVLGWGDDSQGELGDGQVTGSPVTTPVAVDLPSGTKVTQVAADDEYWSLALTSAGHVLAWGDNQLGELGNGTMTSSDTPVNVSLPSGVKVTQVAAGGATGYALTSVGAVYAWGYGGGGTLGDGGTTSSETPVKVSLPAGVTVTQIASNGSFALALASSGAVYAWGDGTDGQLGDGGTTSSDTPVKVSLPSDSKVTQVAGGGQFALAVTAAGTVLAWGDDSWGELGDGMTSTTGSDVPVAVSLPKGAKVEAVAAGQYHALALPLPVPVVSAVSPEDGLPGGGTTVTVTGGGFDGATAVRFGTRTAASVKVVSQYELTATAPAGTGRVAVTVTNPQGTSAGTSAGQYTYLAKGTLLGWGANVFQQLGNGQDVSSDVPVPPHLPVGTVVTQAARNQYDFYAVTSAGAVYAWGNDLYGGLGNGTSSYSSEPPLKVKLPAGTVITAIAADGFGAYALTSTGKVYAWGYGGDGELGNGTYGTSLVPVAVKLPSGTKVTAIAAEEFGGLALTSSGKVLAWGLGVEDGLGDGSTADSNVPVTVRLPSGTKASSIAGGAFSGYVVTTKGGELAFGEGLYGELGNGTRRSSDVPVAVKLPPGTKVTAVAAALTTAYALTSTGKVLAFGRGTQGELGNGGTSNSDVPVPVSLPVSTTVTAIAGEYDSGLARTSTGGLLAWGNNILGSLGDGGAAGSSDVPVAVKLPAGVSVTALGQSEDGGGAAVITPVTVVTGLSPSHGSKGTKVTVTGLNLTGATTVLFGTVKAKFTVVSPTKVTATAPAGTGTVNVRVTTQFGTSATSKADKFTYSS
jgi:alpha-tubulin suppressor-like RCC1 family protein